MALSKPIGFCTCPDCGYVDCEIKEDKNKHAYRFCPDCNIQTFTRDDTRSERMKSKMRPVNAPPPIEQEAQKTDKPHAAKNDSGLLLG